MIKNFKKSDEQKIQLTMKPEFMSSKDSNEKRILHTKSDGIEIMIDKDRADISSNNFLICCWLDIKKDLEESMEGSGFVFDYVDGLHYKSHMTSLRRCGSYIDSPEWIKSKKATTNTQNNDKNCFKYVVTVALNHENIGKNLQKK